MKKLILSFFSFTIGLASISCTNDNIEELTLSKGIQEEPLDTSRTITFSGDVSTIVNNNCMPCHGNSGSSINLTTYANLSSNANSVLSRINSGSMPKGGPKLSDNKILTIKTWIDAGKKNN